MAATVGTTSAAGAGNSSLGSHIRWWRRYRDLSQERLACSVGTTCRYISFLENGRAVPSRAMLERLAHALAMDARQRDALFEAAGYLPIVAIREQMTPGAGAVIDIVCTEHMPHPAFALQPDWTLIRTNPAADRLFRRGTFPGDDAVLEGLNAIDIFARPDGLRPWVCNWEEYIWRVIQDLYRLWRRTGIEPPILERIRAYPEVAAIERQLEPPTAAQRRGQLVLAGEHDQQAYVQLHSHTVLSEVAGGGDVRIDLLFPV